MTARSPLAVKIVAALELLRGLRREHGPERVAVAWTGGKDSTVALDLWRRVVAEFALGSGLGTDQEQAGARVRVLSVDTGLKFPEVVAFRDCWAREWGLDMVVARPEIALRGYPVAVDKVGCCRDLKVAPLQRSVREMGLRALIAGLRGDEHASRSGRQALEPREVPGTPPNAPLPNASLPDTLLENLQEDAQRRADAQGRVWAYLQCNPLLDWSEMEIWAYITGRGLPFCELYGQGYRSLGCVPCTARSDRSPGRGERSGRAADKEAQLETLRSLGYF